MNVSGSNLQQGVHRPEALESYSSIERDLASIGTVDLVDDDDDDDEVYGGRVDGGGDAQKDFICIRPPLGASSPSASSGGMAEGRRTRHRTCSTSSAAMLSTEREPIIRTTTRTIYTAGRPPWYDCQGQLKEPFVIGVCGGSASGKTTVADKIIQELGVPWVTLLSMDSFYK